MNTILWEKWSHKINFFFVRAKLTNQYDMAKCIFIKRQNYDLKNTAKRNCTQSTFSSPLEAWISVRIPKDSVSRCLSHPNTNIHTHVILYNSWGKQAGWYSWALVMKMNLNSCCNESSHNGSCGILTSLDSSVNHADYVVSALRRVQQNVTNEANITNTEIISIFRTGLLARLLTY